MEIIHVTRVNVLGGSFFGSLLTALCFGVLTVQTATYYHAFPSDGRPVKLAVAFLWRASHTLIFQGIFLIFYCKGLHRLFNCWCLLFGALQLLRGNNVEAYRWPTLICTLYRACITWSLYWWSVINYHNPLALDRATWEFLIYQINTVFASVIVQTFFAYRVYSLSASLYVGVLLVLVLLQFGFGAATAIRANINLEFQAIVKDCKWLVVSWLTIQATADIVIATCMCLLLRRRRTGFQKTDSVINRMALYTISTGLITSVLSCFLLVVFVKFGFHALPTLYPITMLANLHMRTTLRVKLATPTPLELISRSVKKRMWKNAGDRGSEEGFQATA
ncbi:hypothetical protein BS47DRAFT_971045 [Hydnum rufescens UP504]|uniref:DUF6534 domain-containing protein n=1 Tax=Hydnum rufescens UP504 TaxID=1448309 RepID=A0A9P6AX25_9AGAM|nr:hypothetical protein BS47DRAFT_971045 [Hydnum rufescens UP504]